MKILIAASVGFVVLSGACEASAHAAPAIEVRVGAGEADTDETGGAATTAAANDNAAGYPGFPSGCAPFVLPLGVAALLARYIWRKRDEWERERERRARARIEAAVAGAWAETVGAVAGIPVGAAAERTGRGFSRRAAERRCRTRITLVATAPRVRTNRRAHRSPTSAVLA